VSDLCKGTVSAKAHTNGFAAFGVGAEFAHAVGFFSGNISSIFDFLVEGLVKVFDHALPDFGVIKANYGRFGPYIQYGKKYVSLKVSFALFLAVPNVGTETTIKDLNLQIGHKDDEEKPVFASLRGSLDIETIKLEEALELFNMPRTVGETDDFGVIKANYGRFGPYIQYGKKYVSRLFCILQGLDLLVLCRRRLF
jgi:hypothetical protein